MSLKSNFFQLIKNKNLDVEFFEKIWQQANLGMEEKDKIKWVIDQCIVRNYLNRDVANIIIDEFYNSSGTVSSKKTLSEKTNTTAKDIPKDFHKYKIIKELGSGNMGRVFLVFDPDRKLHVALKIMLAGEYAHGEQENRFFLETGAMQRLDHPNVVKIYDVGKHDGIHYFTMQYLEGVDLDTFLKDRTISSRRCVEIFVKIAQGLQHAHDKSILHRDIKPGNIIIINEKEPIITDFGLARSTREESRITQTGAVIGTPAYMAPEQARGRVKEIDERTDIYSLGITLYKMLTRQVPFSAATPLITLNKVVNSLPTSIRKINPLIPQDLENICMKAIEKEKDNRFASVAEMVDDLHRFLDGVSVRAAQSSPRLKNFKAWLGQHKLYIVLSFILIFSLCLNIFQSIPSASLEQNIEIVSPSAIKKEFNYIVPPETSQVKLEIKLPLGIQDIFVMDKKVSWEKTKTGFLIDIPLKYGENLVEIYFLGENKQYYKFYRKFMRQVRKNSMLYLDNSSRVLQSVANSITPLKLKWKFDTKSQISFSPLVFENKIYFGSRGGIFYSLDREGTLLWEFATSAKIKGFGSIFNDVVYFGNTGEVNGLDTRTGALMFNYNVKEEQRFSPLFDENMIYVNTDENNFYAVNLKTSNKKWQFSGSTEDEYFSSPAFYENTIIIAEYNGRVYSLNRENGEIIWKKDLEYHTYSTPIVINDIVYISYDGIFIALDARDGNKLWDCKLKGEIRSTGIVHKNMILIPNTKGILYLVDLENKKIKSTIATMKQHTKYSVKSSPAMAGDDVFLNTESIFYSVNIKTRKSQIYHDTKLTYSSYYYSSPIISDSSIYVGGMDGYLYAYEKIK